MLKNMFVPCCLREKNLKVMTTKYIHGYHTFLLATGIFGTLISTLQSVRLSHCPEDYAWDCVIPQEAQQSLPNTQKWHRVGRAVGLILFVNCLLKCRLNLHCRHFSSLPPAGLSALGGHSDDNL